MHHSWLHLLIMCTAAGCLVAENSTVHNVSVTLAALTAEGYRIGENRVNPERAAFEFIGFVGPLSEVTGVLVVLHHRATVNFVLSTYE